MDPSRRADDARGRGRAGGTRRGRSEQGAQDTGEAYGLSPAGLTVTIGFGPSLFDDRFGLADRRPVALEDLPASTGDQLETARSGGDLCVQACADDPQVAVHAVRNLVRLGFGVVAVRWSQLGFGRTSSTSTSQATGRGRTGPDGAPAIPATAHVRLAHASGLGGIRILRRGYTFTDGTDGVGHLDAGLFFIAFVRDPGAQFVPMQRALAQADGLNEYIELNGSAVFAGPPGTHPGQWWGQARFT